MLSGGTHCNTTSVRPDKKEYKDYPKAVLRVGGTGGGLLLPALTDLDGREQHRRCGAAAGLAASAGVGGTGCWLLLPALVVITGGMLCGRPSLQSTDVSWSVLDGRERDWQWGAVTRPLPASTGVGGTGSDRRQGAAAGHRNPRRA